MNTGYYKKAARSLHLRLLVAKILSPSVIFLIDIISTRPAKTTFFECFRTPIFILNSKLCLDYSLVVHNNFTLLVIFESGVERTYTNKKYLDKPQLQEPTLSNQYFEYL